jgi:hypothetical protein
METTRDDLHDMDDHAMDTPRPASLRAQTR